MAEKASQQSWLQRFNRLFPSSRAGVWAFSYTLHHIDSLLAWCSNGRSPAPGMLIGAPVAWLTAKGSGSNEFRSVALLCMRDEDKGVFIASKLNYTFI